MQDTGFHVFVTGMIAGVLLAFLTILFVFDPDVIWKQVVVENGHGEYNRTTGKFQFLPPCNKKEK